MLARLSLSPRVALLLLLATVVRLWVAESSPLLNQETYHWAYAAHPAVSYFDHPPMVGWTIAAVVGLVSAAPFAIRIASLLFGLASTLFGILLIRDLGGRERAQSLWVLGTVAVPVLGFSMSLAMTEGPLLCFWMLTMWALWRARQGRLRWWVLAGLAAGGALLSKYSAAFLLPGGLVLLTVRPQLKRQLRSPGPWIALLLAILCFLPVVLWNAAHGWASFSFQTVDRYRQSQAVPHRIAELLVGQALMVTPGIAWAMAAACAWWLRRWRSDARAAWILGFGLPLPIFMALQAPWVSVKLNWLAPAYLALLLGAVLWWTEARIPLRFPRLGVIVRASAIVGVALMFATSAGAIVPWAWGNNWTGWRQIAAAAESCEETLDADHGGEDGRVFFFTDGVNEASALSYWLHRQHDEPTPVEPVLAQNFNGDSALAFDYWTPPASLARFDAVAILREGKPSDDERFLAAMRNHFESVEWVEQLDVHRFGITVQRASIWRCRGYKPPPEHPSRSDLSKLAQQQPAQLPDASSDGNASRTTLPLGSNGAHPRSVQ